mgnify:FL=1
MLLLIIAAILLTLLIKLNSKKTINQPQDVVLDYANNFYVSDSFSGRVRVQKFSFANLIDQTVTGNGTVGSFQYQLYRRTRVIIDPNGDIYAIETSTHQIKFWRNGTISGQTIADIVSRLDQ